MIMVMMMVVSPLIMILIRGWQCALCKAVSDSFNLGSKFLPGFLQISVKDFCIARFHFCLLQFVHRAIQISPFSTFSSPGRLSNIEDAKYTASGQSSEEKFQIPIPLYEHTYVCIYRKSRQWVIQIRNIDHANTMCHTMSSQVRLCQTEVVPSLKENGGGSEIYQRRHRGFRFRTHIT